MDAAWKEVEGYIREQKTCRFTDLLTMHHSKMYTIIAFLVILELMKVGKISVVQEETFGEILIKAKRRGIRSMKKEKLEGEIEAILFAMGDSVEARKDCKSYWGRCGNHGGTDS